MRFIDNGILESNKYDFTNNWHFTVCKVCKVPGPVNTAQEVNLLNLGPLVLLLLLSRSGMSDSFWPRRLWSSSLLCSWDFPGKNTGFPFPSPEDLPNPGTKPASPALADRFFYFFFPQSWGMWNISSLTRDQTTPPAVEVWSLNHSTTKEVPRPG